MFTIEGTFAGLTRDDYAFLVFKKVVAPRKYARIYKTECKLPRMNKFEYNIVTLGTDTMCDGHDDQECIIELYKYMPNGNHKLLSSGDVYLQ